MSEYLSAITETALAQIKAHVTKKKLPASAVVVGQTAIVLTAETVARQLLERAFFSSLALGPPKSVLRLKIETLPRVLSNAEASWVLIDVKRSLRRRRIYEVSRLFIKIGVREQLALDIAQEIVEHRSDAMLFYNTLDPVDTTVLTQDSPP